jgi:hypothetical protein
MMVEMIISIISIEMMLDLSSNELETLNSFRFKDLLSLQYLDKNNESLKRTEPNTFKNLVNLKSLVFDNFYNISLKQIIGDTSIVDIFSGLENSERFHFDHIKSIETFKSLISMFDNLKLIGRYDKTGYFIDELREQYPSIQIF